MGDIFPGVGAPSVDQLKIAFSLFREALGLQIHLGNKAELN